VGRAPPREDSPTAPHALAAKDPRAARRSRFLGETRSDPRGHAVFGRAVFGRAVFGRAVFGRWTRSPAWSVRRGRHCRLQRHRRGHLLRACDRGADGASRARHSRRVAHRRRAGVCWRDGLRGACGAAAARGRRVRVPEGGVRTPRGIFDGWTSFVAGFSGAIAANALGLAEYIGRVVPAAADGTPIVTVPLPWIPLVVSRRAIVALLTIGRSR
jgi:hypothetical protein